MTELLLCLAGWCAMALGMDRHHGDALRQSATAPTLQFVERVANPAVFADVDEERSLKVLVYRAPAGTPSAD